MRLSGNMLRRKMLRDIKNNISQYITIFLMIGIGLMAYTGIEGYMLGMIKSGDNYYEKYNLQNLDAFGNFDNKSIDKVKRLDHIKDVNGRLSLPQLATLKEFNHSVRLNFIEENSVSKFYIDKGEKFSKDKKGCWISSYYAKENNIKVGDILTFDYDKFILKEKVLGIIYVPDKVYEVKDESEIFPDHTSYGFVFMSINEIPENLIKNQVMKELKLDEKTFEMVMPNFNYKKYIRFNTLMIDVDKESNKKSVKSEVEKVDEVDAVVDIKDEFSYQGYQSEIDEGKSYIGIFSGLFLFIALLSVITSMTRLVQKERVEIGTLKALGFSNLRVCIHYIGYGLFVSIIGVISGILIGYFWFARFFIGLEMSYFEVPIYHVYIDSNVYLVGLLVIVGVLLTTFIITRSILSMNAADTLRVERPKVKNNSLNITRSKLFSKFSFSTKWNIRDIIRSKGRTIMGIAGICGCMVLLVAAFGMRNTMDSFIKIQFEDIYNYDYKLNLSETISDSDLNKLINDYDNHSTETLTIEVDLGDGYESNTAFINDSNNYVRNLDKNNNYFELKDNGIYITRKLAVLNDLKIGDTIKWHVYGDKKIYESKIIGLNMSPQTQNLTMSKKYAESIGIKYKPDSLYTNKDLSNTKKIKGVSSIQSIGTLKEGINDMLSTMMSMIVIIIIFAALLGAIIIYNMGILSFTEKNYQFATLKVLGFSNNKISKIFIKQNVWIAIISIIIGMPLGYYVLDYIFKEAIGDSYDFAAYVHPLSYVFSALGTLIVTILVSLWLTKKIKKIDMVSSLKGNE